VRRSGEPPGPCVRSLIATLSGMPIALTQDPMQPNTYVGCVTITMNLSYRGTLGADVTGSSSAGGTWTGSVSPSTLGPGPVTAELCVRGTNVNVSVLPCGQTEVATVSLWQAPAEGPYYGL